MIACPICYSKNHHLSLTCTSCGSFLQQKVENLDLFETLWKIIETPQKAFKIIALARHKNYIFFLSAFAGIGFAFFLLWFFKIGEGVEQLFYILLLGILLGPALGILVTMVYSLTLAAIMRAYNIMFSFKNILAVVAYGLVPIIFSVVFILPVELLTFGRFLFTSSPSPYSLKPLSTLLLFGLDGICVIWSLGLIITGIKVVADINWAKSITIFFTTLAVIGLIVYFSITSLLPSEGVIV